MPYPVRTTVRGVIWYAGRPEAVTGVVRVHEGTFARSSLPSPANTIAPGIPRAPRVRQAEIDIGRTVERIIRRFDELEPEAEVECQTRGQLRFGDRGGNLTNSTVVPGLKRPHFPR